jgi:2-methylisocitrate lyase-like PEP mutase family enzyme
MSAWTRTPRTWDFGKTDAYEHRNDNDQNCQTSEDIGPKHCGDLRRQPTGLPARARVAVISKGARFRERIQQKEVLPLIGIYDAFSASLAAQRYEALFVSGFGFAASHLGLPDIGFIAWPDILEFVRRLVSILPHAHLLVDIDDGYCDIPVACHVVSALEQLGASGVVLEDQQRPRLCGHMDGKRILPLEEYLTKLRAVLSARRDLVVVARTDASDPEEINRRVVAFREAGCDAILVDGLKSLDNLSTIRGLVDCPVAFNQIAGGKSPVCTLSELQARGVGMVIYSTPCLFAAQTGIEQALDALQVEDGSLANALVRNATLNDCNHVLFQNLNLHRK